MGKLSRFNPRIATNWPGFARLDKAVMHKRHSALRHRVDAAPAAFRDLAARTQGPHNRLSRRGQTGYGRARRPGTGAIGDDLT